MFTTSSASLYHIWTATEGYLDVLETASLNDTDLLSDPVRKYGRFIDADYGIPSPNRAYRLLWSPEISRWSPRPL